MKTDNKFFAAAILLVLHIVLNTTPVEAQTQGTFGSGLTWGLSGDGTLRISGNGTMPVSVLGADSNNPWFTLKNRITSAVIEDGVTTLSLGAFDGCTMLTSITIGKGITAIPDWIVRGTSITSIIIPDQIAKIATDAFTGANKLEIVYFNAVNCDDFAEAYGAFPFPSTRCPALKTVVIGDTVKKIPDLTFSGATALTSLTIGRGVTVIGRMAFRECAGLTNIVIPDNVQTVEYRAFYQCTGVTSITLGSDLSETGIQAFSETKITELTIPENVSKVREGSFGNNARLQKVNFNATSCQNVDVGSPFLGSQILSTIIFADNVRRIPDCVAKNLKGLESVTIGSRVNQIGDQAFSDCDNLEEIINKAARPQAVNGNTFYRVDKTFCTVRVPSTSLTTYRGANWWKDFPIEAQ